MRAIEGSKMHQTKILSYKLQSTQYNIHNLGLKSLLLQYISIQLKEENLTEVLTVKHHSLHNEKLKINRNW
jgi:hypothetical protein